MFCSSRRRVRPLLNDQWKVYFAEQKSEWEKIKQIQLEYMWKDGLNKAVKFQRWCSWPCWQWKNLTWYVFNHFVYLFILMNMRATSCTVPLGYICVSWSEWKNNMSKLNQGYVSLNGCTVSKEFPEGKILKINLA